MTAHAFRIALGLVALAALLATVAPAHAEGEGVVEGRLVNGTAEAGVPASARVTLYAVRDRALVGEQSQAVDPQGGFRFSNLDTDPGLVYLLVADYSEIVYPHPQLLRLSEQPQQRVEAVVYETTRQPDAITFERANLLLTGVDQTQAVVMEMGAVANRGDRTYVGDQDGVLRLHLPPGATSVVAEAGLSEDDLQRTAEGLTTLRPIPPGRHQVAIRYAIPLSGSVLDLSKELEYGAETFSLFVPAGQLKASSPQLLPEGGGAREMGGGRFDVYTGQDLAAGTRLVVRVSGLPAGGGEWTTEQKAAATLGGGVLLAALALVLATRLRGRRVATNSLPRAPAESPEAERARLVMELAELDERFSAGGLAPSDYYPRRTQRKERLLSLVRQLEQPEAAEA